jgi:hypothetical protein
MALFGIVMFVGIVMAILYKRPRSTSRRVIHWIASGFLVYGCVGFLGQLTAGAGGLAFIPPSFQWPVVWPETSARDLAGNSVVGLAPSGRIQTYDQRGAFVRGWFVPAGGGSFKLRTVGSGNVEVFTARGDKHLLFSPTGALLEESHYSPPELYDGIPPHDGAAAAVAAPWFLWPLASPLVAFLVYAAGLVGTNTSGWREERVSQPT